MGLESINGLDNLAAILAGYDYEANRARIDQDNRLKQLTAAGLQQRERINEGASDRGMLHSGNTGKQQVSLIDTLDTARQGIMQQFNDRLANLARRRIREETQFNISSLLPR